MLPKYPSVHILFCLLLCYLPSYVIACDTFNLIFVKTAPQCHNSSDGKITAVVEGGTMPYTYQWSTQATGQALENISAGFYTLTVTDLAGCEMIRSVTLDAPAPIYVSMQAIDGNCGAAASVGAVGIGGTPPYFYDWNTGANQAFLNDVAAGTYTVTLSDFNGCAVTDSVFVATNEHQLLFEIVAQAPTCHGDSDGSITLYLQEGQAPFSYFLNGMPHDGVYSDLAAGIYTIFVEDAQGCTFGTSLDLQAPPPIALQILNFGDGLEVVPHDGYPPYTFAWEHGATEGQLSNLPTDAYTVTVTDQHGCTTSQTIDVLNPLTGTTTDFLEQWQLSPNPASDVCEMNMVFRDPTAYELRLVNTSGTILWRTSGKNRSVRTDIPVQHLAKGLYFVQLVAKGGDFIKKLVVL